MEAAYFTNNGSRRSRSSQNSRGSRREGCTCICNRDSCKNIMLVISLVLVLALTAALLVLGLSSQRRYTATDMKQSVEQQVRQFWHLFNADKLEMLVELYAPDGRLLPPGQQVLIGKPAILEHFKTSAAKSKVTITDGHVTEVEIISDVMAFSVSDFALAVDGINAGRAKSIMIWKKIEGVWLIYRDFYNDS